MTGNLIVENCLETDLSIIQKLCDELYSEDPNIASLRVNIALTQKEFALTPEKGRLLALKDGDTVIGYCIIIFFWSNEYSGDLIEIDELYIAKSHQGLGIGTQLFKWLQSNYLRCKGFSLQVADKNARASKWYADLGFKPSRNQHLLWVLDIVE